jgi:polyisoprenyl-phosphate glycosyltransferase
MNGVRLVIVVPCYNEEEVLKETTRQLSDVLARMEQEGKVAEGKILYVDDGSKDTTWKLIEQLSESHRCVAGLKLAHNVGQITTSPFHKMIDLISPFRLEQDTQNRNQKSE